MHALSVVIPCHNNQDVLPWILRCLKDPGSDFEVICVDDESDVDLGPIVGKFGAKFIRLPQGSAGRRAMARNVGHRMATGAVTLYLDGDVIPEPRLVAAAVRMHGLHDRVAFKYPVYNIPQSEHRVGLSRIGRLILENRMAELGPSVRRTATIDTRPLPRRLRNQPTNLWTLCASHCLSVRWRDVEEVGGWDEKFTEWGEEDLELAFRLYESGVKFIYPRRNIAAAFHIDHPVNWSTNLPSLNRNARYFREKFPQAWPARAKLLRLFLEENDLEEISVLQDDADTS